jgi:uncharacterized protein
MMNLSEPLSDDEIDELDRILIDQPGDIDPMSVSMLDGFLTAVVSGPNTIMPSMWMPWVWDVEQGVLRPKFRSERAAQRFYELVFRHMNSIAAEVREAPEDFEPLLLENPNNGDPVTILDDWCMGFMKGLVLDIEGWTPLTSTHTEWFTVLRLYGTEDGWEILEEQSDDLEQHQRYADQLPEDVRNICRYWLERRVKDAAEGKLPGAVKPSPLVMGDRPGRNDPCPCRSGKKFKRCHGSPERLH